MAGISFTLHVGGAPAGADLLAAVQEVQVEENADLAGAFRLRIAVGVTGTGEWSVLQDDLFTALTPVRVQAQVGTAPGETLIDGYVTEVRADLREQPGESVLEVVGLDATVLMNMEEKVARWANMADSDIATAIFSRYGLTPKVESTQPVRQETEITVIQRETDIRFLRRLAERNGFRCAVEPDPLLGTPVGIFGPPDLDSDPQGVLSVNLGAETNVSGFSLRYEATLPVRASAAGVTAADKSPQQADAAEPTETLLGARDTLAELAAAGVNPQVIPMSGLSDGAELQALAQAVANRSAWAVSAEGDLLPEVYGGLLRARRTVNVRGAGALFSGTYLVTRVLHVFSPAGGYAARFELQRNGLGLSGSENFAGPLS